jgi:POTRA domain, FtsQ-type/Cell division protein FtsQ
MHFTSGPSGPQDQGPVGIHPRFARRWADARRAEGRRRLRIVVAAVAVIALVGAAAGTLLSPLARVRHVRVDVAGPTSAARVVALAGLANETLMIGADPKALAHRLDAVPGLGAARVRRVWPSTIDISVATREPIAVVAIDNGPEAGDWALVDATGRVLSQSVAAPNGMTAVYGVPAVPAPGMWIPQSPGPAAPVAGRDVDMDAASDDPSLPAGITLALAAIDGLTPSVRAELVSATVGTGGAVTLGVLPAGMVAGSIPVYLGDGSQLAAKLVALVALLKAANLSGVKSIDLSVPDRPTALTVS